MCFVFMLFYLKNVCFLGDLLKVIDWCPSFFMLQKIKVSNYGHTCGSIKKSRQFHLNSLELKIKSVARPLFSFVLAAFPK